MMMRATKTSRRSISRRTTKALVVTVVLFFIAVSVAMYNSTRAVMLLSSSESLNDAASTSSEDDCSSIPHDDEIVIDKSLIQQSLQESSPRLQELTQFTDPNYEKHMMNVPGQEHYALLQYLVQRYGQRKTKNSCHVVDIGTRYVASALALGSHYSTKVWTFDIPTSFERQRAFRGTTENQWQQKVKAANVDISFHNLDLLQVSDADFQRYVTNTWLVLLDTFHKPDTVPFEREFMARFIATQSFRGIVLLDDIYLNPEMKKWWKELQDHAPQHGYTAHDVTFAGHFSGTGLLDFSGKVRIVKQ